LTGFVTVRMIPAVFSVIRFSIDYYDPSTTTTILLHPFNGLFSRTTWVSRYQKGKTSLGLNEICDDVVWDGSNIS